VTTLKRPTTTTSRRECSGGKGHDDAATLVEYLISHGGKVAQTNGEIAHAIGFMMARGGGTYTVDMARFNNAVAHVKDRTLGNGPCTGYRLHYRPIAKSGTGSMMALVDPNGSIDHVTAAIENAKGWMAREAQHHTENLRQIETFETLAMHAFKRGDHDGYRACTKASMDIDRDGTVSPSTMAELNVWLGALAAASKP
jgi:hypothetical protein